ncbi:tRNA pseudouridine(55) synthase TruB [Amaricoccus sp.]|uniref:tRNA pseudouridine(55) synthase TruB n=1 Tax=Amaricoccus sp. TaxID=1872485 RepID=UPI002610FD98|nr:tRNA pseudouridine(55) synthase TruB [Amaricoccus sp.]HRO12459.1 tRNA pseudouridine(55) synthase TruB [Amaricoccus sp.]
MARRSRGRPVHGWLIVDKPAGLTSSAVVGKARWALGAAKAGHAGTLDPAATGLLAVAFGEATKTVPFVADARKAYRFTLRWGAQTATDDAEGEVIATSAERPSPEAIRAALPAFTGDILQVPPQISAVKVDGQRAYDLARAGEALDLAARPLHVERLELVAVPGPDTAVLEMTCGKGGYVRAIARDLGIALGCLGHVAELRRLWSGPFTLAGAVTWPELEAGGADLARRLRPIEAALAGVPELACPPHVLERLRNGNPVPLPAGLPEGTTAWASAEGRPVAIGTWRGGELHPSRVLVLG